MEKSEREDSSPQHERAPKKTGVLESWANVSVREDHCCHPAGKSGQVHALLPALKLLALRVVLITQTFQFQFYSGAGNYCLLIVNSDLQVDYKRHLRLDRYKAELLAFTTNLPCSQQNSDQ